MFENDFESMLRKYGDVIDDRKRFTGLLKDFFPEEPKYVNLMQMAYDLGIAQQIQSSTKLNNAFAFRFVKQLTDDYGMSRMNADWVVSVWCVCYGKDILGKDCEIRIQSGKEPVIEDEKSSGGGKTYGDLFQYRKSSHGNGLAVCGFTGDTSNTVILQNISGGNPVIEVGEGLFADKDIEEVIITEGYQMIGAHAFERNQRLHQAVMPYTLLEIGDHSFDGCSGLRRITLTERLEKIGEAAFRGTGLKTVVFPTSLYYIGNHAFAECRELDNIRIPENIDTVSEGMFEGCPGLIRIELSKTLKKIGNNAFKDCTSLDIVTIPDSVQNIGEGAFEGTDKRLIIQCSFGSYAEQYAREHKIKYQLI